MGMIRKSVTAVLAALVLAGCSGATGSGNGKAATSTPLLGIAQKVINGRRQVTQVPRVNRALLSQIGASLLEVTVFDSGLTAYLGLAQTRRDRLPGTVEIWQTQDGASVNLRDGILISTRGLGGDIVSSDVTGVRRAIRAGGGRAQRVQFVRTGNVKATRLPSICEVNALGDEQVQLVDRVYQARVMRETCVTDEGRFENTYWIERRSGKVIQSLQWAGPEIGYARTKLLR